MSLLRSARAGLAPLRFQPVSARAFRTSSRLQEEAAAKDVLDSIKADLKTAMRAKDKPRLTAIRAILAEVTNADKAGKPTKGDQPMYNLLQKQINSSKAAIEQCREAKREDLIAKETEQLEILQSYLEQIPVVAHEELDSIVTSVVQKLEQDGQKVAVGPIMGKVMGLLAKKPFDTTYLKSKVEEATKKN